jgi:hypothetical protein
MTPQQDPRAHQPAPRLPARRIIDRKAQEPIKLPTSVRVTPEAVTAATCSEVSNSPPSTGHPEKSVESLGQTSMQITRKLQISNRVFTAKDLLRFAHLLDNQITRHPSERLFSSFEVMFADGVVHEGTAAEVFAEECLIRPSRPVAVSMRLFSGIGSDKKSIRIDLRAGDSSFGNDIVITGSESIWANATYTSLKDALDKAPPQKSWVRMHPVITWLLLATGSGAIIQAVFDAVLFPVIDNTIGPAILRILPNLSNANARGWVIPLFLVFRWAATVAVGNVPATLIFRWIQKTWPRIEFDFGSPHLRPASRQRTLVAIWTLMVVPTLVQAMYDLLKSVLR